MQDLFYTKENIIWCKQIVKILLQLLDNIVGTIQYPRGILITLVSIITSPILVANLSMTRRCPINLALVTVFCTSMIAQQRYKDDGLWWHDIMKDR